MKLKVSSLLIMAIFALSFIAFADGDKDDKKSNAIKTKVSERENPPVHQTSALASNDETYDYMSSPKLEDCTKPDFDRE